MRHLLWGLCVCGLLWGCHQKESVEQGFDLSALKKQFVAKGETRSVRLASGMRLIDHKDGQAFLVAQYWAGHRNLVQAVIDSAHVTTPPIAAELLARLMASAGGEAKLHFETQLITLGDAAVEALVDLAESETDWQTLMRTLDALGKIGAKQGVPIMEKHLGHSNDWVRITAAHALGDVGGDGVVPVLEKALRDSSDTVVVAALVGLGKAGDRTAVVICGKKLDHENPRVRGAAVSALGRLGGEDAQRYLEPMVKDADSGVRFKAKQALENIRKNK